LKVTSRTAWISGILINLSGPTRRAKKCVDVKSTPHAKHTASRISWLHTCGPGVESEACQSIFPETDKGWRWLDKTWNLPGGTRQFRIYGY
jgi:hypothetical protein